MRKVSNDISARHALKLNRCLVLANRHRRRVALSSRPLLFQIGVEKNRRNLSSQKILLFLLVCAIAILSCNASSALSQLAPTQVPTLEAEIALPAPSATISSITPDASPVVSATIVSSVPPVANRTAAPSATSITRQALAASSPTASSKTTATPTKSTSAVTASTATKTSTPKTQTGCVANSPQAKPSGMISSVTLGTKSSSTATLVPASVFATNATIHAVVATQNAPATAIIKAEWYATDVGSAAPCNTFIDRAELSADPSIDFTLAPSSKWPIGTYRVEISVNGTLDRVVNFSVK